MFGRFQQWAKNINNSSEYGPVTHETEKIYFFQEIVRRVHMSAAVTTPKNGYVYILILNTNEDEVKIESLDLKCVNSNKYHIYNLSSTKIDQIVKNRLEKLKAELRLDHPNQEERESIEEICRYFNDLFSTSIYVRIGRRWSIYDYTDFLKPAKKK